MWIMPSIRPRLVERVFATAPPTSPGIVVVDRQDAPKYQDVTLPASWSLHVVDGCPYFRDKVNRAFADFPDAPFYGVIGDDMVAETPGWDVMLAERAGTTKIAGSSQVHFDNHIGAGCIGGDLVRALGWLCLPVVTHFYSDAALELIGAEFGCLTVHRDIRIAHHHFAVGLAEKDASYAARGDSNVDGAAFHLWQQTEWPALRERLRPLYQ